MRARKRALLASLTLILTAVPLTVVTSLPAEAAYGVCDSASWRYAGGVGTDEYTKVPVRTGSGMHCYMGNQQGSKSAVMALQDAIHTCYWDTPAADYIQNSGGVDGVYGEGTVKAVRWLQANRLGFTGQQRRRHLRACHPQCDEVADVQQDFRGLHLQIHVQEPERDLSHRSR